MADPSLVSSEAVWVRFAQGSLLITGPSQHLAPVARYVNWDERVDCYRAEARRYGPILLTLHQLKIPFRDDARRFGVQSFQLHGEPQPRPHQQEALTAWKAAKRQGVVVLPTGTGKTLVARLAIAQTQRDTLILVPTIDLLQQWHQQLSEGFAMPIGMLGGGEQQLATITVSTYDSAYLRMEQIGDRFGLLICDECHHLPAATTRMAAICSIAPFRLGLTATPERSDGQEEDLYDLLGPLCYRSEITDLRGQYLAPYRWQPIAVHLDQDERIAYDAAYAQYREFVRSCGVQLSQPNGWNQFVQICHRSQEGRAAYRAYLLQKRLARASRAKLRAVWSLLRQHKGERVLLFTDDNATAYAIGETFFLPVITHHTRAGERKKLLDLFRSGSLPFLVNSHVLNEGVDVPDVAVGIIVSGSGSVRAHVQRLGRILRPREGKQAVLYELVSEGTAETFTSEKRRQHLAYQR